MLTNVDARMGPTEVNFYGTPSYVGGLAVQGGHIPEGFGSFLTYRNVMSAIIPPLDERFQPNAQAVYSGLDPRTSFFPENSRRLYPRYPPEELTAVAAALSEYGIQSLRVARATLGLGNLILLGLANKADVEVIQNGQATNKDLVTTEDELGTLGHAPATDIGVVGPREDNAPSITLAMCVADCLAIPIVDPKTGAFAYAHAGRPGTGLRTAEVAVRKLMELGSKPKDLIAYLGEGMCRNCCVVDQAGLSGFMRDFGGKTEIDKVIAGYPEALRPVGAESLVAVDLHAFNTYLLRALGIGKIVLSENNCTARCNYRCISLRGRLAPAELDQPFFSDARVKNETVGWQTATRQELRLQVSDLGTPRNLATLTRF